MKRYCNMVWLNLSTLQRGQTRLYVKNRKLSANQKAMTSLCINETVDLGKLSIQQFSQSGIFIFFLANELTKNLKLSILLVPRLFAHNYYTLINFTETRGVIKYVVIILNIFIETDKFDPFVLTSRNSIHFAAFFRDKRTKRHLTTTECSSIYLSISSAKP